MSRYYDRAGQPMTTLEWAMSFEDFEQKVVAKATVGDAEVSTVWLGLNHQFGDGPPLIFETMIFGGEHDQWQDRYSTEEQAKAGHEAVVAWLKGEQHEPGSAL
jgi:hypothetical protein